MWHYVGGPPSRRSLCLFWWETRQRVWTRDFWWDRKWGRKGRSERSQRGSWQRETQSGSKQWTKEENNQCEVESRGSEEDRQDEFAVLIRQRSAVRKTVKDELAFLVAYGSFAQIHASISLQIHRECSVTKLPILHFELTQAHIVCLTFVLFLPLPVVFFVAVKKCEIPQWTTRWITGQDLKWFKEVDVFRAARGVITPKPYGGWHQLVHKGVKVFVMTSLRVICAVPASLEFWCFLHTCIKREVLSKYQY